MFLILLSLLIGQANAIYVPVIHTPKSKRKIVASEPTDIVFSDSFLSCPGSYDYRTGIETIPMGSGCLSIKYKKNWAGNRDGEEKRELIKYPDMVKDLGKFKGIQITHYYDSNGSRTPVVYVFYKAK